MSSLLLALGIFPGGPAASGDYAMTDDEILFWQHQAALLDPDAYEYVVGTSESRTVTTGKTWYLVNGWNLDAGSDGTTYYHRQAHVGQAMVLSSDTTIATPSSASGPPFMYICKPELVVEEPTDDRYDDYQNDPRGLYFERIMRLGQLEQFLIGDVEAFSGTTDAAFPGDFDDGLCLHVSAHDVAWLILYDDGSDNALNTMNELSDSTESIRFAEPVIFPFKRTTFPKILIQGSGKAEGRATMTYAKIDGIGW